MKQTLKKIGALIVSVAVVMSLSSTLFAAGEAELTGGEVGGYTTPDTPVSQSKKVKIAKEITAYNVDEDIVNAPTITYSYSIAGDTNGYTVTDETTDHASGVAITKATLAGITTNVSMTGTAANEISWTPAETLNTSKTGEVNYKYLTIDFTNVVFTEPGVYRYVLTEDLKSGFTYDNTGVTETTDSTGGHTRYLDVYVRRSDTFTDGSLATDWDIYGYVCMYDNEDIDPTNDTDVKGAVKTNGFVAATNDNTEIKADSYYTFNVTVSKTLTGDAYSASHKFPIQVDYTNARVTQNVKLIADIADNSKVTDYAHDAVAASSLDGLVKISDGGSVKYIGIPCGTQVDVYETNDVTGTIYRTTVTVDGTAGTAKDITSTSTPGDFVAYSAQDYNSNLGTITTTANQNDDATGLHTVEIDNVLQLISPTGIIVRSAPYILLFGAAAALFVVSRRWKKKEEA